MLEVVDDLMTPGCANCAIKHLAAALSYIVDGADTSAPPAHMLYAARALVNLTEVVAGYNSHLPFAIGLMERAEMAACQVDPAFGGLIRRVRLDLIRNFGSAVPGSIVVLAPVVTWSSMAWAHVAEASRELKMAVLDDVSVGSILGRIDEIHEMFFGSSEKESEDEMACKKKCVVKGGAAATPNKAAKATRATAKGGCSHKCK